jgi:hypothetical protein
MNRADFDKHAQDAFAVFLPLIRAYISKRLTAAVERAGGADRQALKEIKGRIEKETELSDIIAGLLPYWDEVGFRNELAGLDDDLRVVAAAHREWRDGTHNESEADEWLAATERILRALGYLPAVNRLKRVRAEIRGFAEFAKEAPPPVAEAPPPLVLGGVYTRRNVHQILGGGVQEYLPHKNNRVVCATITPASNPDAPRIILPAKGPNIVKWARVFAAQREAVPVFLKRGADQWEYVGNYRVERSSEAAGDIAAEMAKTGRNDITMVLYLTRDVAGEFVGLPAKQQVS